MQGPREALVIGLDLGTGGARVVIASAGGELRATGHADLEAGARVPSPAPPGWHEQDPETWWKAARWAIRDALRQVRKVPHVADCLRAICVDGTSGTVVGIDRDGNATTPALMYNDARAEAEAHQLDALAHEYGEATGPRISASFGIAKMLWIQRHLPEAFAATHMFAHQADFIAGRLTGQVGTTDYSNAMKSGFDLTRGSWAEWIDKYPDLRSKLPRVMAPGESLGDVSGAVADELGLPRGLTVIAGATDGTAAFLASGARRIGDNNTTLGTTLVFKRVADRYVQDPDGLLYCHKLPGGSWLPGAASNVGGDWIRKDFAGADLRQLDDAAGELLPTQQLAYPLRTRGDRFPFKSIDAVGFCEPEVTESSVRYAANLQGTAFVERLGYEVLDRATAGGDQITSGAVYATGGGSRSDVWMQLRADVCGRAYHRPSCHESAFGSAILAAAGTIHESLRDASQAMVRIARTFRPDRARHEMYEELYQRFLRLLEQRGFLTR